MPGMQVVRESPVAVDSYQCFHSDGWIDFASCNTGQDMTGGFKLDSHDLIVRDMFEKRQAGAAFSVQDGTGGTSMML